MTEIEVVYLNQSNTVTISKKISDKYNINDSIKIVKVGSWEKEMIIKVDEALVGDIICLPTYLIGACGLPTELPCELLVCNHKIEIGPVIAMVAFRDKKEMTYKSLEKLKPRFLRYHQVNGLVFVCAANCIIPGADKIEGYCYNPNPQTARGQWIFGEFPFPNVVYKRVPIDTNRFNYLASKVGNRVINSNFFLKADLAAECEKDKEFASYFPHTEILRDEHQIRAIITKFQAAYIKPSNGSQGEGIYKVSFDQHERLKLIDRDKNIIIISNSNKLRNYLGTWRKKEYIIQEAIHPINNKTIDFRVYVQKNGLKKWVCQGMIGRIAKIDTIITNLKYVDRVIEGQIAIQKLLHVERQEALELEQRIYDHCIGVCMEIDKRFGTYGDVAVDVIVDSSLRVWILEINKVYGYNGVKKIKNKQLLDTLYSTPFDYAKAMAGF